MGNSEFTKIILDKLQQTLKPYGFRKKGSTFIADPGEVRLAVQFEKCWVSTNSEVVGYVNLAALSRLLIREGIGFTSNENSLRLSDWHLQTRLGFLTPQRRDRWWTVRSDQEAVAAGAEIAETLTTYGLPVLEQLSSTEKLRIYLEGITDEEMKAWLGLDYHRGKYLPVLLAQTAPKASLS